MMQALSDQLNAISDAQPFGSGWHVRNLRTGEAIDRNGGVPMPSASTRKVSIMMAALREAHHGRIDLAAHATIEARLQKDVASGTYRYMTPGGTIPIRDAIVNMIITSDNVCTQIVLEQMRGVDLNAYCSDLGMVGTAHRHAIPPVGLPYDHPVDAVTATTPADQGHLLDLIVRGAEDPEAATRLGCSPQHCQFALDVLSWQMLRTMIPSLLPYGTKVASKSGRGRRGRMDVGVVYRDQRPLYIITAFTDHVPEIMPDGLPGFAAAFATVGRLSRACWDAI
jgi:beta-lactamase class A